MAAADDAFRVRVLEALAEIARARAVASVNSETIKEALDWEVQSPSKAVVFVPHYWAAYIHDGRGVVPRTSLPAGRYLVWYKDPSQDPRIQGGYPVRAAQIRRLTRAEFQRDFLAGKLLVRKRSGPAAGQFFFSRALAGFDLRVGPTVTRMFAQHMRMSLPNRKSKIRIRV